MARFGAALIASVCAVLLVSLPTCTAIGATATVDLKIPQVFCDMCGNGVYDAGIDTLLAGVNVYATCTVKSTGGSSYTYTTATVQTDSSGSVTLPFTSSTTDTTVIGGLVAVALTALGFDLTSVSAKLQAALTGTGLIANCELTATGPASCPNFKFSNGACQLGVGAAAAVGANNQAPAADVKVNVDVSGLVSLLLGDDLCFAPDSKPASCPTNTGGDPHFSGADGSQFDFSGEPNEHYCLLSDSHLHINTFYGGRYGQYESNPHKALNWIRKVGILWGHHTVVLAVREGARWQYDEGYMSYIEVDGARVIVSQAGDVASMVDGKIQIKWVAAKEQSADDLIDVYEVRITDVMTMTLRLRPEVWQLRTDDDGVVHFDIEWAELDVSDHIHGVLGQTYRKDFQGRVSGQSIKYSELLKSKIVVGDNAEGFLDGQARDYQTSDLLKADCKFSRFTRATRRDVETAKAVEVSAGQAASTLSLSRKMLAGKLVIS